MAKQKILSLRELDLMRTKKKVTEITQEPVFIRKEIVSILKALGCKCIDKWTKSLEGGKKLVEFGIIKTKFNDNKFYRLSDFWELLLTLDQKKIINLSAAGLNSPQDLADLEIPLYQKDPEPNVGFSHDPKREERNLYSQGFWENGIRALEK